MTADRKRSFERTANRLDFTVRQRPRRRSEEAAARPIPQIRTRPSPFLQRGINRFLDDLYGEPRLLSDILEEGGFTPAEIATLRDDLRHFLPGVVHAWIDEWRTHLHPSEITALLRAYGLDGRPPADYEIWDEVTEQALEKVQRRLRRARLERAVLVVAKETFA